MSCAIFIIFIIYQFMELCFLKPQNLIIYQFMVNMFHFCSFSICFFPGSVFG